MSGVILARHHKSVPAVNKNFQRIVPDICNDSNDDRRTAPDARGDYASFVSLLATKVLPKTQFVDEEGMDDSVMAEGEVVVMRDETGEELHGVVIGVSEEEVEVDFNHPLAGIDLHFSVQVMATGASKG